MSNGGPPHHRPVFVASACPGGGAEESGSISGGLAGSDPGSQSSDKRAKLGPANHISRFHLRFLCHRITLISSGKSPMASTSPNKSFMTRSYQIVVCPKCHAKFRCYRSLSPPINEHGFESYHLECKRCDASILAIIDPADNELVLSEESSRRKRPVAEKVERTPKT